MFEYSFLVIFWPLKSIQAATNHANIPEMQLCELFWILTAVLVINPMTLVLLEQGMDNILQTINNFVYFAAELQEH